MAGLIIIYLLMINGLGFFMMGLDKRQAKKERFRISENQLLLIALFGGGVGSYLGMNLFRHKTKRWSFRLVFGFLAIIYGSIFIQNLVSVVSL